VVIEDHKNSREQKLQKKNKLMDKSKKILHEKSAQ
jgi:hypothetical protein